VQVLTAACIAISVAFHTQLIAGQSPDTPDFVPDEDFMWLTEPAALIGGPPGPARAPLVVIDPGHGYRDYGVVGVGGTREKDIVLEIAQYIKQLADEDTSIEVRLTRKGDDTVPLVQRADSANRAGGTGPADAFVSVHVATWFDPTVAGFQVYYPGGGADDFDIEDVFEIGKTGQRTMKHRWDRPYNRQYKGHVRQSELLAQTLDARMDAALKKRRGEPRHAPLRLLRIVDMPSCLIEVGTISNSGEEARLEGTLFRHRCGEAIYNGLRDFFGLPPVAPSDTAAATSR